ncbi:MAG TPA: methylenetetrahydrofolate reductase C-terminal domain-containing protein [Dongiaceae bacterium]|nr:methylenetetrahydrofolate reductase C-terminal domain-containing protein [Dongiaceae bacterium]
MYSVRLWSVRHAKGLNAFYRGFEKLLIALHPLWNRIGYDKVEEPFQRVEKFTKGFLFDCQMCGQCALSSTGMSCPMNCPKTLRNGPCGGVRDNGHCEVKPEMKCVWVQAWNGAANMGLAEPQGHKILDVQKAVDNRFKGKSSWLRVVRIAKGLEDEAGNKPKPPAAAKPAPKPAAPADSLAGGKSTATPTPPTPPAPPSNPGKAA